MYKQLFNITYKMNNKVDLFNKKGYNILNRAFKWDKTEEGHTFWQDLHNKWRKLYICLHNLVT